MSSGDPQTRQRILQETRRLLEASRGQNVRLEDIAKAAGVSRQALYLHFGSRTELLIATARYLDEVLELQERLKPALVDRGGERNMEAFIEFWAYYIPDVYSLAKALMVAMNTDEAAAAAWKDRMEEVYVGCMRISKCLERDDLLDPVWTVETATDYMFATFSVQSWETLTIGRGWTNEQYADFMKLALKRALMKST